MRESEDGRERAVTQECISSYVYFIFPNSCVLPFSFFLTTYHHCCFLLCCSPCPFYVFYHTLLFHSLGAIISLFFVPLSDFPPLCDEQDENAISNSTEIFVVFIILLSVICCCWDDRWWQYLFFSVDCVSF